jgi:hypothetical protein
VALAVYREGLNATSPFYFFLAFWNVLDAVFRDERVRDAFLSRLGDERSHAWRWSSSERPWPPDMAEELRESSRNAIAHVVRRHADQTVIDPDLPSDRERLREEADWLHAVARTSVEERWPRAVVGLPAHLGRDYA